MTLIAMTDDAVVIDVDITPLPTPSATVLPPVSGGSASVPGGWGQGWLAVTGLEPSWFVLAGAVAAVAVGVVLSRARGRRP
ncbi:hypothetical protein [Microbacterium enclense]|uniref:hypothetical protein n=1 Tax=Microbacterium enclense TaxID=993073 RepID=UPI00342C3931